MDPSEIISGIKLFIFLNAPGSNTTLKIFLKMILKQANSLSIQQIVYTNFLLSKMSEESRSAFSKALFVALPVVFETQIQIQLDPDKINDICDYLNFATKKNLSEKTTRLLTDALLSRHHKLSSQNAISVLWSLADVKKTYSYHQPLIEHCFRKITDSIDSLNSDQLSTTLSKCCRKYINRNQCFYNEDFVEALCGKFMSRYTNWKNTLYSLKRISILVSVVQLVCSIFCAYK